MFLVYYLRIGRNLLAVYGRFKIFNVCELVAGGGLFSIHYNIISDSSHTVTALSDTLLVHLSGFVHPTRSKIQLFDSAFQALYIC